MNIFIYCLNVFMLCLVLSGWAYSGSEINAANESSEKSVKSSQEKNKMNMTTDRNQMKYLPPEFVPSEKIKADSSVPFPVDI